MAFIKRSTVTPVNVKVGKHMCKCSQCGKQFVTNKHTKSCPDCFPQTEIENSEATQATPDVK